MNLQIFGFKDCQETRKAQRFFAERRIPVHVVVLDERPAAKGELRRFSERFGPFPVTVAMLSRFLSPAEQKRVVDDMRSGRIDVVIGTHALIQEGVDFASLGAVVIDEQHRFGVEQRAASRS